MQQQTPPARRAIGNRSALWRCGAVLVLACTLAACGAQSSTVKSTATKPPLGGIKGQWNLVTSPAVGQEGALAAVTALSASDAWAVGQYEGVDGVQHPLAEHWGGSQWAVVATPSPGMVYNILKAVSADAPGDAWAVGQQASAISTDTPLIEHWNGSAWALSAAATVSGAVVGLTGVAALSPNDVWAVGSAMRVTSQSTTTDPLIEHWDGSRWGIVAGASLPAPGSVPEEASLRAVAAVSATDVWAVGSVSLPTGGQPLIEHWNGSAWTSIAGVSADPVSSALTSVAAVAANDVWAVGTGLPAGVGGCGIAQGVVVEHWDGSHWSLVPAAQPPPGDVLIGLTAVSAASASDVWIVGGAEVSSGREWAYAPLIEHWDGTHWNTLATPPARTVQGLLGVAARSGVVFAVGQNIDRNGPSTTHVERWTGTQWTADASPSPGTLANALHAVTGTSAQDVWAVGSSSGGTLTEHFDGSAWQVAPSANTAPVDDVLYGVSTASSSDVWAVGDATIPGNGTTGQIEHWNGTQWASVSGAHSDGLRAVAAISAHDVWAGGDILEHYDGSAWHMVANNAGLSMGNDVLGLAGVASNDVWAVGGALPHGCGDQPPALIEHWNGSSWSAVPNTPYGTLYGVAALGPSDVWAVGTGSDSNANGQLIMHYDGHKWSVVPSHVGTASQYVTLYAVTGSASNNLWAVGHVYANNGQGVTSVIIEHWDGTAWGAISPLPNPGSVTNELDGVVALPGGAAWAVGSYGAIDASQALLLHYLA